MLYYFIDEINKLQSLLEVCYFGPCFANPIYFKSRLYLIYEHYFKTNLKNLTIIKDLYFECRYST